MDEKLLREKAKHYLVCYYEPCERRQHIAEVCRRHGWTAESVYDETTEEYDREQ